MATRRTSGSAHGQLRRLPADLEHLLNAIPEAVIVHGTGGVMLFAN